MSGQEWITTAVLLICAGTDFCSKKVYRWVVMLYMTLAVAGRLAAGMAGGMSVFVAGSHLSANGPGDASGNRIR